MPLLDLVIFEGLEARSEAVVQLVVVQLIVDGGGRDSVHLLMHLLNRLQVLLFILCKSDHCLAAWQVRLMIHSRKLFSLLLSRG